MNPGSISASPWPYLAPILLLVGSNVFMTLAWYGHLKFKSVPLITVIVVSWGIAFCRILLGGAGKPDRGRGLFSGGVEDDPGGDHAYRVRGLHRDLFPRAVQPDSRAGFLLIALGAVLVFRGQP